MLCTLVASVFLLLRTFTPTSGQAIPYSPNATVITLTVAQKNTLLNEHNNYRRQQPASNMQQMQWSDWLAAAATNWSQRCYYEHAYESTFPGYNQTYMTENLYVTTGTLNVSIGNWAWYTEISAYNYTDNNCYPSGSITECGHYTQMVWATSNLLGCGASFCGVLTDLSGTTYPRNCSYLVCMFSPPGNINGQKPYTQGTACSNCPTSAPCCNSGLCTTCSGSTTAAAGGGAAGSVTTAAAGSVTTAAAGSVTTAVAGSVTTAAAGSVTTAAAGSVTTAAAGSVTTTAAAAGGGSGGSGGGGGSGGSGGGGAAAQATTTSMNTTKSSGGDAHLQQVSKAIWLAFVASLVPYFLH